MSGRVSFDPSRVREGPVFYDELRRVPGRFRDGEDIQSLRLVPARSAAAGVHTIFFKPEHRNWALVRLVKRYRGLFEILLQRGLSGERQLMQQGFQSTDVDFLLDIIPKPEESHSTLVYDLIWLASTHPEYRYLAEELLEVEEFYPRDILESNTHLSVQDAGLLTRFVRSHVIVETAAESQISRDQNTTGRSNISIQLDESYSVTEDGREALKGVVAEYDRIFEQQDFEPLLLNPELDPYEHLRTRDAETSENEEPIALPELEEDVDILGEIAAAFESLDEEPDESGSDRV